jgi:HlyD family secretion protein
MGKNKEGNGSFVVLSTVQPQEYGFIEGKVTYVSDFPITQQGMMTSVKMISLRKVYWLLRPLFEVHVDLKKIPIPIVVTSDLCQRAKCFYKRRNLLQR